MVVHGTGSRQVLARRRLVQHRIVTDFAIPPMTMNKARSSHYHAQAKAKKVVGDEIVRLSKFIPPIDRPVHVEVIHYIPNKVHRDADGLGYFLKSALDGLVQANVLEDDYYIYVPRTACEIVDTDMSNPRIEVLVTEV